ncbi:MAG: excinuclease ABC subunit UvrC [Desulfobacterales bacterium]
MDDAELNDQREAHLRKRLSDVPESPGVYLMRGEKGKLLYVGKAKNLRKRVSSYFLRSDHADIKTRVLVRKIHDFETIVTRTEKEALLLESNLIKRHRPRYNVVLKDDKRYPVLKLDVDHPFPNLSIARKMTDDGALYFGPFASAHAVRETVKIVNRTFKLRRCRNHEFANRTRPCLHYQMGACLGPCVGLVDTETYREVVNEAILFLRGRTPELIGKIRSEMAAAVEAQAFEKAAVLRDKLFALEKTLEKQTVVTEDRRDRDVVALARSPYAAVITLQTIRGGCLQGSRNFRFKELLSSDADLVADFLRQYYEKAPFVPEEILVAPRPEDPDLLEEWFLSQQKVRLRIHCPQRGVKRRLVEAARRNAEQALVEFQKAAEGDREILEALQRRLNLDRLPRRIECYDNSNLSGDALVGARVVFEDAIPARSLYRTYRIRGISAPDDYAAMAQVMRRRFAKTEEDPVPDLLLVDGGKGQMNVALAAIREAGMADRFAVAGIAKPDAERGETEDKIFLPNRANPVNLTRNPRLLFFLMRVRDEAHRFAITAHRRQRKQAFLQSDLDRVPGVGPKRKALLLSRFGSVRRIREATPEDLSSVPGISREAADRILAALQQTTKAGDARRH